MLHPIIYQFDICEYTCMVKCIYRPQNQYLQYFKVHFPSCTQWQRLSCQCTHSHLTFCPQVSLLKFSKVFFFYSLHSPTFFFHILRFFLVTLLLKWTLCTVLKYCEVFLSTKMLWWALPPGEKNCVLDHLITGMTSTTVSIINQVSLNIKHTLTRLCIDQLMKI